ncbi:MAG: endonuclease/exonuclease/phosphatase family protein [Myxococcales bacterium]|nr:endonuclease/exonuclease/phosphatase family protein [Myxococcales bacterium]
MTARLATFNLANLARPGAEFYGIEPRSEPEVASKRAALQDILRRMNADVVGVQEIFHEEALTDLVEGLGYAAHCPLPEGVTEPDARSPRVGLLTRLPLVEALRLHRDLPEPRDVLGAPLVEFRRPVLEARVALWPDLEVTVFVVHLKSPRPHFVGDEDLADPAVWALAEARAHAMRGVEVAALKALVGASAQRGPTVLMGDLNAQAFSPTLNALLGRRPPDDLADDVRARFEAARLYDPRRLAPGEGGVAFGETYFYAGRPEVIDHVLVSHHFTPWTQARVGRVMAVRSLSDHLGGDRGMLSRLASDHAPAVVTIAPP